MADETPKTEGSLGGQGATPSILPSASNERRDLRMLERAIKQKWKIDERAFEALPSAMLTIALDRGKEDRNRIAAARVVATMHGQNQDEGKLAGDLHLHQHNEQTINDFSGLTDEQLRQYIELCELARNPIPIIVGRGPDSSEADPLSA